MTAAISNHLAHFDMMGVPLVEIRPEPSKAPIRDKWGEHPLSPAEVEAITADSSRGLGVMLGGPTGIIDIEGDGPGAEAEWQRITAGLDIPDTLGWKSTKGIHRLFSVPRKAWDIIGTGIVKVGDLEIRLGDPHKYTHQSVIPPHTGREWVGPEFVSQLPKSLALRIQAERFQTAKPKQELVPDEPVDTNCPGYIFGQRNSWEDLLSEYGWTQTGTGGEGQPQYRHKDAHQEVSATLNYQDTDKLYCFSDNAFESGYCNGSLDKFAFYAEENFSQGPNRLPDYSAAAAELRRQGYHRDLVSAFDDISAPDEPVKAPCTANKDIPTELLLFPGFVEKFAKYHCERSQFQDLRAGAVAGIMLQSWMLGQRVALTDGTRPNLFAMYLSPSGFGKTEAIGTATTVLEAAGFGTNLRTDFKSWQAMEESLEDTPNMIYVREEIQDYLAAMEGRGDPNKKELASFLKRMATASKSSHRIRTALKADGGAGAVIDQPHVSVLMTGVTDKVWKAMSPDLMEDGTLGRYWMVETSQLPPDNPNPNSDLPVPRELIEHIAQWRMLDVGQVEPKEEAGEHTQGRVIPVTIEHTPDAKKLSVAFRKECRQNIQRCADVGSPGGAAWSRAFEMTCRFDLIVAASANAIDCHVTKEMIERSIELSRLSLSQKIFRMENQAVADIVFDQSCKRLLAYLRRKEEEGKPKVERRIAYSDLNLKAKEINEIIVHLSARRDIATDAIIHQDGERTNVAAKSVCLYRNRELLRPKDKK